jgi:hypothetical protein
MYNKHRFVHENINIASRTPKTMNYQNYCACISLGVDPQSKENILELRGQCLYMLPSKTIKRICAGGTELTRLTTRMNTFYR